MIIKSRMQDFHQHWWYIISKYRAEGAWTEGPGAFSKVTVVVSVINTTSTSLKQTCQI